MLTYILIESIVLAAVIFFVCFMCLLAKRWIWPGEPLHPSYVGALISCSATIFAASIAWSIADRSIELQRSASFETEQARHERVIKNNLVTLAAVDAFLQEFPPSATDKECAEKAAIAKMAIGFPQELEPSETYFSIENVRNALDVYAQNRVAVYDSRDQKALKDLDKRTCDQIRYLRTVRDRFQKFTQSSAEKWNIVIVEGK